MIGVKCIVFPTDFSDGAAQAARYARLIADRFHAELHVLHVIHDVTAALPDFGMGLSIPSLRDQFGDRKDRLEEAAINRLAEVVPADWEQGKRVVLGTRFGAPEVVKE
jgi:universal stress protein A